MLKAILNVIRINTQEAKGSLLQTVILRCTDHMLDKLKTRLAISQTGFPLFRKNVIGL